MARVKSPFVGGKVLHWRDRLEDWAKRGTCVPVTWELDASNACPHNCRLCIGGFPKSGQMLSLDFMKSVIKEIAAMGGKGLIFSGGGEPLTNPDTVAAVEFARTVGLKVGFITNLFKPTDYESMLKHCQWWRVSVDAVDSTTYQYTHGVGPQHWANVVANIHELIATKRRLSLPCKIGVAYLTDAYTSKYVVEFAALAVKWGADYAQFRPYHPGPRVQYDTEGFKRQFEIARKEFGAASTRIVRSEPKYQRIEAGDVERHYPVCHGHHFATTICADMGVYLCCHMRGLPQYKLGDLSTQSLFGVWHSDRRKEIYTHINYADCPRLCRCDDINYILEFLAQEPLDLEFL